MKPNNHAENYRGKIHTIHCLEKSYIVIMYITSILSRHLIVYNVQRKKTGRLYSRILANNLPT